MTTAELGSFELVVMLSVMQVGAEGYSLSIRKEIERRTGREVRRGALYITLDRLVKKGLLESWMGESRPERGGRARRHYRATEAGREAVRATQASLRAMWDGLEEA
jgi:PadR family transcriptional regulator, regulatory protein PadR